MNNPDKASINWKSVVVYYAIACLWSWPFFWRRDILNVPDIPITSISMLFIHWGMMWGPGIAALVCMVAFRRSHRRVITFAGNSWTRSILFYATPFLLLAAFRAHTLYGYGLSPLFAAFPMFVSILGEELGWRGFLQDALRPLSPVKRFVLIGLMWEFWHFTTRTTHGWSTLRIAVTLLISYSVVILLSFVLGFAAERSYSVVVAVSLHMYIDMILNNLDLYLPLLLALPIWALLLLTWPKDEHGLKP
ncbi:MAG: type II CAAX prenyl endopeptidase Rce1 family protein [Terracidiphilus sp.]